jgi:outer membrane protein OmpA-like peptidoglycan-associated protein
MVSMAPSQRRRPNSASRSPTRAVPWLALGLGAFGAADLAYLDLVVGPAVLAGFSEQVQSAGLALSVPSPEAELEPARSAAAGVGQAHGMQPAATQPVSSASSGAVSQAAAPFAAAAWNEALEGISGGLVRQSGERRYSVFFPKVGQDDLPVSVVEALNELGEVLSANLRFSAVIVGHADERGTFEFNWQLGRRRAQAVAQLLIDAGIASERLQVGSRGEREPAMRGSTHKAHAANRRVEIEFELERSKEP